MTWLCYFEGLFLSYPVSSRLRNKMGTNDNWIPIQEQLGNNHDLHTASSKHFTKPQAQWRMDVTSWYKRKHSWLWVSHIKNAFHKTAFLLGTFLCPSRNSPGMQLEPCSMKFLKAMLLILNYILCRSFHKSALYNTLGNCTTVLWQISVLSLVIFYFTQSS